MATDQFIPIAPHIPCMDRWPPDCFTQAKQAAYDGMAARGAIQILSMKQGRQSGITIVRYLSNCPHEWILQQISSLASDTPQQITIGDSAV